MDSRLHLAFENMELLNYYYLLGQQQPNSISHMQHMAFIRCYINNHLHNATFHDLCSVVGSDIWYCIMGKKNKKGKTGVAEADTGMPRHLRREILAIANELLESMLRLLMFMYTHTIVVALKLCSQAGFPDLDFSNLNLITYFALLSFCPEYQSLVA